MDEPTGEDVTLADSIGSRDPDIARAEMRVLLDDAFEVLSDRDREVLRLRFTEDLTQTEISNVVGVSQMQVSRIIRQALRALRDDIERTGPPARRRVGRAPGPPEVCAISTQGWP